MGTKTITTAELKQLSTDELLAVGRSPEYKKGPRVRALRSGWLLQDAGLNRPTKYCVWRNGEIVACGRTGNHA